MIRKEEDMKKAILAALGFSIGLTLSSQAGSAAGHLSYKNADDADHGVGAGIMYTWDLQYKLRADGRFGFVHFGEQDVNLFPVEATIAYQWDDRVLEPYAGLGVGYYIVNADKGDADNEIGFQLFAGLEADIGWDMDLFAELNWLFLSTDVDQHLVQSETSGNEMDFNGMGINVGLLYRF